MEKPLIKPRESRFGTILRNRKLLATVSLLGGLFVLKATGCLDSKSVEPEVKKPKLVEQAPNINKSQQRVREALVAVLSKKEEPKPEIQASDDVGFGGPDPEIEEDSLGKEKKKKRRIAIFFFLNFSYRELDLSVRQTGFDRIDGMNDLMIAFKGLQEAIEDGDKEEISDKAKEFLRLASVLRTSEAKKKYREIESRMSSDPNGEKLIHSIKSVLIPACGYAEQLAS